MKKPDIKIIVTGLLLLPLVFLGVYTMRGISSTKRKPGKINVASIKVSSPTQLSDDIAALILENDFETAKTKINDEVSDPNIPTSKGTPLLLLAVAKNNLDFAAFLIDRGSDVNFADVNTGETALIKAARNGSLDMLNLLISVASADTNMPSKTGITPLLAAIESGKKSVVDFLISRGALAGVSKENLIRYSFQKNGIGVEAMLKGGASPLYADKNGNTALIAAAANGDIYSVKVLLAYRSDINFTNKLGMTALLYTVKANNMEISKYLIERGADVNKANNFGETPLYYAALNGNTELVNILLTLNANYNALTSNGVSPLAAAQKNGFVQTAKLISDFIAYKKIPRDSKGRPILPKKTSSSSSAAAATPSIPGMPSIPTPQGATAGGMGAAGFDMSAFTGGVDPSKMTPQQIAAMQKQMSAAGQQGQQAQQATSAMQPKDMSKTGTTKGQKTVINKLQTSSL